MGGFDKYGIARLHKPAYACTQCIDIAAEILILRCKIRIFRHTAHQFLRQFSRRKQPVNMLLCHICTDFIVKLLLICTEFTHITEYRYRAALTLCEYIYRCPHRDRVCIIAIIDHEIPACLDQIRASTNRARRFDTGTDLLRCQPKRPADCCRRHRIIDIMHAGDRHMYTVDTLRQMQIKINSSQSVILHRICINRLLFIGRLRRKRFSYAVKYRFRTVYIRNRT